MPANGRRQAHAFACKHRECSVQATPVISPWLQAPGYMMGGSFNERKKPQIAGCPGADHTCRTSQTPCGPDRLTGQHKSIPASLSQGHVCGTTCLAMHTFCTVACLSHMSEANFFMYCVACSGHAPEAFLGTECIRCVACSGHTPEAFFWYCVYPPRGLFRPCARTKLCV